MKKIINCFCLVLCCFCFTACSNIDTMEVTQKYSYFPQNENRYILVDASSQKIGDEYYKCKVIADKYIGTMYLLIEQGWGQMKTSSITQLFYEDGSPMIYDNEGGNME